MPKFKGKVRRLVEEVYEVEITADNAEDAERLVGDEPYLYSKSGDYDDINVTDTEVDVNEVTNI